MIHSVGIIGLGSFGKLAASLLSKNFDVVGYDTRPTKSGVRQTSLADVMKCDAVILAIPFDAYQEVLKAIKPLLKPETLLIDICSVKIKPSELLDTHLPNHPNLLVTHPLFGPETAAPGKTRGHKLIVTKHIGNEALRVMKFCREELGLVIHRMSPQEHDRTMAQVHALTFFVARGLADTHIAKVPFETPSFQMILDLIALDRKHSDELFQTIERGNPYAAPVRHQLIKSFENLAATLENTS